MAEDPLDDRPLETSGAFSDDRGDDPESSLDALASRLRDRADGAIDEDGSLASLAAELTGTSETSSTTAHEPESHPVEPGDSPRDGAGSGSQSASDASRPRAGAVPEQDGPVESGSLNDPLASIRASSTNPGERPADPSDVLDALDNERGSVEDPSGGAAGGGGKSGVSPGSVLVLGGLSGTVCDQQCVDLLTAADGTRVNALFVSVSQSIDDRLAAWRAHASEYPVNASHVAVGGRSRTGSSSVIETRAGPDKITVDSVSDPADLTRLGITLTRRLEEWAENPYPTVVCVHSVTELLQYVEPRRLFRFVQVLQNTLDRVDGSVHYHLDPDAHDDRTLRLFQTLVDETIRLE